MNTALMFSTGVDEWETPPEVFDPLHAEFGFTLDVAAGPSNHKVDRWLGPGGLYECGLSVAWRGERCWMNPPYSRRVQPAFIKKAALEAQRCGVLTVALLPARTDTRAFHRYIWDAATNTPYPWCKVRFWQGRIWFVGAPASAPFPSMVVVFGGMKG
jgi:DNA N-6-adenine-methyltransferase (Dam)